MDGPTSTPAQRWLARLSFVLAGLAIVILLVLAGLKSPALAAAVVGLAAAYFFLSRRGIRRSLSLAIFVLAPIAVIVVMGGPELVDVAKQIPVGVDGESILMPTPVTCTVSPGALRVWMPRDRPGVPAPKPPKDWARPRYLAGISKTAPRSPY